MQAVHILCPAGRRGSVHIQREEMHEELGSYPVPSRTAWKPQYHGGHSARSSWFISCAQQDGVEAGIRCLQWSARSEVHILCPAGRRGSALPTRLGGRYQGSYPVPSRTAWKPPPLGGGSPRSESYLVPSRTAWKQQSQPYPQAHHGCVSCASR